MASYDQVVLIDDKLAEPTRVAKIEGLWAVRTKVTCTLSDSAWKMAGHLRRQIATCRLCEASSTAVIRPKLSLDSTPPCALHAMCAPCVRLIASIHISAVEQASPLTCSYLTYIAFAALARLRSTTQGASDSI
eukprot:550946-Amphidinium_carterae.1